MNLTDIAKKNSGWIWRKLREARKHNFQIGEESITDFFILNFKKFGKGKLDIKTFTRPKEAVTGADWEWWFTGPSGKWIGMRVQAKILNLKSRKYEHLHYKNETGSQLTILLKDASVNSLIPIYCMYSNWDPKIFKQKSKCGCKKHSIYHYGASILAPQIIKTKKPEKSLNKFINHLIPLQCLFCTSKYGGSDLPSNVHEFSQLIGLIQEAEIKKDEESKTHQEETNNDKDSEVREENNNILTDNPPKYVRDMVDLVDQTDYFDFPDKRLQRVTIIKEISID